MGINDRRRKCSEKRRRRLSKAQRAESMGKSLNRHQYQEIGKGTDMAKKLQTELKKYKDNVSLGTAENQDYRKPAKTYWHIYGLQTLNPDKFAKVVNKITEREYILIK